MQVPRVHHRTQVALLGPAEPFSNPEAHARFYSDAEESGDFNPECLLLQEWR